MQELLRALMKEVIEADAQMQVQQRSVLREALGSEPLIEGLDRREILGLLDVRLSFDLERVPRSWRARLWEVLNLPLEQGWTARATNLLFHATAQLRLADASVSPDRARFKVTLRIGRATEGHWREGMEVEPPQAGLEESLLPPIEGEVSDSM